MLRARDWIASIDGMRALAVGAVVLHHLNSDFFAAWAVGNVGVAVFFAISGFLAFYVLWRDEQRMGRVSYSYFLMRRILRIWPAYLAVILTVWAALYLIGRPLTDVAGLLTFTTNISMGLWWQRPNPQLAPLWSIAVEEQFYLLAPLMYLALRSRYRVLFCAVVLLGSNAARALHVLLDPHQDGNGGLYYMTYAYLDTFIGGAVAAQMYVSGWRNPCPRVTVLAATVALVAIARLWEPFPPYGPWSLLPYALLPVVGALAMLTSVTKTAAVDLLSTSPMRALGTLSYGIYMVHAPILIGLWGFRDDGLLFFNVLVIAVTLAAATALYLLIERPALTLKSRLTPSRIGPAPAIVSHAAITIGFAWLLLAR